MKIDCQITVNYFKERERMCGYSCACETCPLSENNNETGASCEDFEREYSDKAVEIVQKWSDEHPQKTYKEDFFEKFPNAPRKNDYPRIGACSIYGSKPFKCGNGCYGCWDKVMEV